MSAMGQIESRDEVDEQLASTAKRAEKGRLGQATAQVSLAEICTVNTINWASRLTAVSIGQRRPGLHDTCSDRVA